MIDSQNIYWALWFLVAFAWLCIAMQVAHENRRRRAWREWNRMPDDPTIRVWRSDGLG